MASTSTSTVTKELQDQFLSTVRKSQEVALDAIKTMVDTIQNITPKVAAVNVPFHGPAAQARGHRGQRL